MVETDLLAILVDYSDRNGTVFIEIETFVKELKTQSVYKAQKDVTWEIWTKHPREHFDLELKLLLDSNACSIQKTGGKEYIFLSSYFIERVRNVWNELENNEKETFPDDKKIHITPPTEMLRVLDAKDLAKLLKEEHKPELPIIQIDFPQNLGSMLLLTPFVDTRLLDAAINKVRRALINKEIRQYCLNRIRGVFPDKLSETAAIIDAVVQNPIDCVRIMRESSGDGFLLWSKLCEFITESVRSDATPISEADCAIQQGSIIMSIYAAYYSELAADRIEKEEIFNELYEKLANPPYFWTFTEIYKMTGKDGKPIVGSVRHEEIADFITKKTRANGDKALPPLLIFYNEFKEKCFIKKEIVFRAFNGLLHVTKQKVEEHIKRQWYTTIKEYRVDPAMRSNAEFELLLIKTINKLRPFIVLIYQDGKLSLLRKEFAETNIIAPSDADQFFYGNELKSFTALYGINRKLIIYSIKLHLPFWYSVPLFVAFIKIFKRQKKHSQLEDDA